MTPHPWATLNASLNGASAILLVAGYVCIRRKLTRPHTVCMLGALTVSAAFLASYLLYHAQVGSVHYRGQGPSRAIYFAILISHSILAAAIVPLVLRTVWLAWKQRWVAHRTLARWTLPLWLYVSLTGVIVYLMLYRP